MKVLVQGKQAGVELLHGLDGLPDLAGHDQPLDVLPVPHAGQLSADLGLLTHTSSETLRRAAVAVVDEVGEDCVVEHRLLVPLLPRPTELLNGRLSSSPQLPHLSLNIKFERFLTKVGRLSSRSLRTLMGSRGNVPPGKSASLGKSVPRCSGNTRYSSSLKTNFSGF